MKDELLEFLNPDKRKVTLALLLPFFWAIANYLVISRLYEKLFPLPTETFVGTVTPVIHWGFTPFLLFIISYMVTSALYYPFSCSIITLFDCYKRKELGKLTKNGGVFFLVLVGIFIFNPVSLKILIFLLLFFIMWILKLIGFR